MVKTLPSNAGGTSSIPGQGAKISHAPRPKNQNIKQKQNSIKAFKNDPHEENVKKKEEEDLNNSPRSRGENLHFPFTSQKNKNGSMTH